MATSSIKHHFKIEGKENVERFIAAVEESEKLKETTKEAELNFVRLTDKEKMKAFASKRGKKNDK